MKSSGDDIGLSAIFMGALVGGTLSGIIMLYLFGLTLRWSDGWLGGRGSSINIRAAVAWSSVPLICALPLWIPELLIFGKELFTTTAPTIEQRPFLYLSFGLLEATIGAWAFVVFLKTLGQVHGFSAWRALGSTLLAIPMFFVPIFVVFFVFKLVHG